MGSRPKNNTPREPTPWVTLTTMTVIILYSTVLILYLTVSGESTPLPPTLAGNATVSQGSAVKVTVMAFGGTFTITGIAPCRLTEAYINNTQAPLTPPWVLRSGQSAVLILSDCANVSQVIVAYGNGETLAIPVRR